MSAALGDRERHVLDLIRSRERQLLADLRLHVALPTGGRNAAALDESRDRLTARARSLGAMIDLIPGDAAPDFLFGVPSSEAVPPTAVCRRPASGTPVLLAGHLDTVHDPKGLFRELAVTVDGKTATGPGCADMKGGLVIAVAALEAIEEAGERIAWTLLLNSDEEIGSFHSARAITDEAARTARDRGVGIALEPATAEGGLVTSRAGSGQFMIESAGRAAHVGRDFSVGISAVNALARTVLRASELSSPAAGIIVNIGPLEGGSATNVIPARARAWGNIRFPTPEAGIALRGALQGLAGPHPDGAMISVKVTLNRPAKPDIPAVSDLSQTIRAASQAPGRPLPFSKTAGVCDGNLMQAAGLPTLDTLGVRGGGLHTDKEWIEIPSLVDRCQLLALVLMRVAAAGR